VHDTHRVHTRYPWCQGSLREQNPNFAWTIRTIVTLMTIVTTVTMPLVSRAFERTPPPQPRLPS
jgi:hypothetical protein